MHYVLLILVLSQKCLKCPQTLPLKWRGGHETTIQHKYFEGYKFHRFCCSPAKLKNYFCENEWMPTVTWLNYSCNLRKLFSVKSKFLQIRKVYSPHTVQYPPTMLFSNDRKALRSKAATTNFTSLPFFRVLKTHRLDYRITWRPDCILQNIDNMQCSYSSFRYHCLLSSFDFKAFLPSLITLWVDMIPYKTIYWRGINIGNWWFFANIKSANN